MRGRRSKLMVEIKAQVSERIPEPRHNLPRKVEVLGLHTVLVERVVVAQLDAVGVVGLAPAHHLAAAAFQVTLRREVLLYLDQVVLEPRAPDDVLGVAVDVKVVSRGNLAKIPRVTHRGAAFLPVLAVGRGLALQPEEPVSGNGVDL